MDETAPGPDSVPLGEAARLLAAADEPTRVRGVRLLRDGTGDPDRAARKLVEVLLEPGRYVPHAARAALQTLGADALPALLDGLGAPEAVVRAGCAWALARPQGEAAGHVIAALETSARDPDDTVRHAAAAALARCGGDVVARTPLVEALLEDPVARVRAEAAAGCAHDTALAASLTQPLLAALEDAKPAVRVAAAESLEVVAPPPGGSARVRELLGEEVVENPRLRLAVLLERWETAS